jgi:hypothetical protein
VGAPERNQEIKKITFIELPVIYLNNLKSVEFRKSICFPLKIFVLSPILPPFGLYCPGRAYRSPHPNYAPDCHKS